MPKLIVEAPPSSLGDLLNPANDIFARFGAAMDVVGNYLLQTREVGTLAFYVPAPNPPFFTDAEGRALTPRKLLDAIQTFDPGQIGVANLLPIEQAFLQGYMDGRLIGIPIGRADIVAVPADAATGSGAFFRTSAGIPPGSWLHSFIDRADLAFEIRQSPPVPIEQLFGELMARIDALNRPGAQPSAVAELVNEVSDRLADGLPKVSLDVSVNNFRIPASLTSLVTTASATARLVAYSPRFNPPFVGDGPMAEVTRRGGIAFQGRLRFADLVTIDEAQLAVFPSDLVSVPALAGRFGVAQLGIPGAALHNAQFDFNSAPAPGQPFLAASGSLDPIRINHPVGGQRLLSVMSLSQSSNRIGAAFSMRRAAGNALQGSFSIDPARLDFPMLGPALTVRIHGAATNEPFSFSTVGPWSASATLDGQLSVRTLDNQEIARIGPSTGRFFARVAGDGLALTSLVISNFPAGLSVTTFPGTGFAQTFTLGSSEPARLRIHGDGTFEFTAGTANALTLPQLPAPLLSAGASVTLNQSQLQIRGSFQGGLLAPGTTTEGSFTLTGAGQVTLAATAVIPPQAFGAFLIRGRTTENLTVQLIHDGYAVPGGARLQVVGVNNGLLDLSPLTNRASLDFSATVTSGDFTVPNFFRMSGGTMNFLRRNGVVTFQINSPTVTLLPGSQHQNVFPALFTNLVVATDGRFYADTGTKDVQLLGGVKLQGRLEIGNQPGAGNPALSVSPSTLNFGTVNLGVTTNKVVRLSNTGQTPLIVSLLSSEPSVIPAQGDLSIPVGQFRDLPVQFRPGAAGPLSAQIQVFINPGGQRPGITVSGTGRVVPIFDASQTALWFGEVALGNQQTRRVVIRNLGSASLVLTSASITGPFTFSPPLNNRSLAPNQSLEVAVTFTPAALGVASGVLTVAANDRPNAHTLSLQTGSAYAERLVRLREGGPGLHAIAMLPSGIGWAVGDEGLILKTENGGRSWIPAQLGFGGSFRAIAHRGDYPRGGGFGRAGWDLHRRRTHLEAAHRLRDLRARQ